MFKVKKWLATKKIKSWKIFNQKTIDMSVAFDIRNEWVEAMFKEPRNFQVTKIGIADVTMDGEETFAAMVFYKPLKAKKNV